MKEYFITALKSFFVGASMTLPGISGGTTAIILGIYDKLIKAVSGFFSPKTFIENLKKNFLFLLIFGISALLGLMTLSRLLLSITEKFPIPMRFLFIGAILGSLPTLSKKINIKKLEPKTVLSAVAGFATVFAVELIPPVSITVTETSRDINPIEIILVLVSGVILAAALILPGISFSHMLLVLGLYERFYTALNTFDIFFLAVIGVSLLIGTAVLIKLLERSMENYPQITYAAILGFVVGSIKDVYIGLPELRTIPICILMLAIGFFLVYGISKKEN